METQMINLPNKWDKVTIQQWKEINEIQTDSELTRLILQMSILADVDPEDIRQMTPGEFNTLAAELYFLSEPLKPEVEIKFELDGKKYGIIPDMTLITTGEFADAENWKADTVSNIHYLCAMLYRPIVSESEDGEYEIEKHTAKGFERRANLFLNKLPITIPYGAVLFFSTSGIQFTEIIAEYLETELASQKKKEKKKTKTQSATKRNNKKGSTDNGPGIT